MNRLHFLSLSSHLCTRFLNVLARYSVAHFVSIRYRCHYITPFYFSTSPPPIDVCGVCVILLRDVLQPWEIERTLRKMLGLKGLTASFPPSSRLLLSLFLSLFPAIRFSSPTLFYSRVANRCTADTCGSISGVIQDGSCDVKVLLRCVYYII